ncbi:MAG: hypothetical protein J6I49_03245 [Bacteroidales bacterium]|nr:hypothetical protein [Bacteroidales bacterium]
MKTRTLHTLAAIALLCISATEGRAQTRLGEAFNKFKLEARADVEWSRATTNVGGEQQGEAGYPYGIHGRYFNLHVGGNLGSGFTYLFRQRLKAEAGSIDFFDNTDFLWMNYEHGNWSLRFGKDAMALGGYEYDAPPIDEYFTSVYWDNIYCFQLAAGASYTTDDSRQRFTLQVSQSPYVNSRGLRWDEGLLAYNVMWSGSIGNHLNTLWSTSMVEMERGRYMNLTMLGTRWTSGETSMYLDLMHHALATDDWGKNLGVVFRWDYRLRPELTLFIKGSYEQNRSEVDLQTPTALDNLVPAGHRYGKYGAGCEYRPVESVRLHAYLAEMSDETIATETTQHSLCVNVGATWTMDFHKIFKK